MLPPTSIRPEDGGSMTLRNSGILPHQCTVSQLKRPSTSHTSHQGSIHFNEGRVPGCLKGLNLQQELEPLTVQQCVL
jgi:hypothetical protein